MEIKPKKIGLFIVIFVFGVVLGWLLPSRNGLPLHSSMNKSSQTYRVQRTKLVTSMTSTGAVEPQNKVKIQPNTGGRIEKILVKEGQYIPEGTVVALMSSTERTALMDAARAKGPEEVRRWEEIYKPMPIITPIAGTMISIKVQPGQLVLDTDNIMFVSDRLTVRANVDEADIGKVRLHQNAKVILDSYQNESIEGVVDHIAFDSSTVNNVTTYIVDVIPKKNAQKMRSGMTANVSFELETKLSTLVVSNMALQWEDGKYYVWKLIDDRSKKQEKVEVKIGSTDGRVSEVLEGLIENDVVILIHTEVESSKSQNTHPSTLQESGSND
jgi:macrolide-specific efflux system membrane fusion protein